GRSCVRMPPWHVVPLPADGKSMTVVAWRRLTIRHLPRASAHTAPSCTALPPFFHEHQEKGSWPSSAPSSPSRKFRCRYHSPTRRRGGARPSRLWRSLLLLGTR